uniref:COX assembly mitochondrial protein n=1 Tax=Wuchereria bancrofti TaxID=6293 RepID=A0AAF5PK93_WUCBA
MRMECAADGPIKTDDLHHLREGDIFIDSESGQKFRVRKTALPQQSIGGPHGVGDPNDRSLRRLEADVLIPNRMNEQVQKVECREPLEDLVRCIKKEGSFIGMRKCRKELERYETCQLAN